jgi:hypothetical protein
MMNYATRNDEGTTSCFPKLCRKIGLTYKQVLFEPGLVVHFEVLEQNLCLVQTTNLTMVCKG